MAREGSMRRHFTFQSFCRFSSATSYQAATCETTVITCVYLEQKKLINIRHSKNKDHYKVTCVRRSTPDVRPLNNLCLLVLDQNRNIVIETFYFVLSELLFSCRKSYTYFNKPGPVQLFWNLFQLGRFRTKVMILKNGRF